MKKLLKLFLLSMVLCLGLVGCLSDPKAPADSDSEPSVTQTETESDSETETETESETEK